MKLRTIQELKLTSQECELLRLAGYESIEEVEQSEMNPFIDRVQQVNKQHKIMPPEIASSTIQGWWHTACNTEQDRDQSEASLLINFESDVEIMEMIRNSPLAESLPAKSLANKNVPVSAVPEAILLTAARGDISVRISAKSQKHSQATPLTTASISNVHTILFWKKKNAIDLSRVRTLDAPSAIKPTKPMAHSLVSSTRPETNVGVAPESRYFIRGVLHPKPKYFLWGAFFTIITHLAIPVGLFASVLLLLKDQKPESFPWIPGWILVFPLSVFVFGIFYLSISYRCSCRICGQKLFVPKHCLKNSKAHTLPLLGSILPIALHALLFRWFRCTYCGTAIRLKE